jgi:hypothetical protein
MSPDHRRAHASLATLSRLRWDNTLSPLEQLFDTASKQILQ